MRLYPASPRRRCTPDPHRRRRRRPLPLILFAWLGIKVHDGIARAGQHRPRHPGLRARDLRAPARGTTGAVDGAFAGVAGRGRRHPARRRRPRGRAARRAARRDAPDPRSTGDAQGARLVAARPSSRSAQTDQLRQLGRLADVPDPRALRSRAASAQRMPRTARAGRSAARCTTAQRTLARRRRDAHPRRRAARRDQPRTRCRLRYPYAARPRRDATPYRRTLGRSTGRPRRSTWLGGADRRTTRRPS